MLQSFSQEEIEFIQAIDRYKSQKNKSHLAWSEVLAVVKSLGYQREERSFAERFEEVGVTAHDAD